MTTKESNGKHNGETIFCPVNCWTSNHCPYCEKGVCYINDPVEDCDDFGYFFSDWEEWEES